MKYEAYCSSDDTVSIYVDGVFATTGRLRRHTDGTVTIEDAPAPLGEAVYEALEKAIAAATAAGRDVAEIVA